MNKFLTWLAVLVASFTLGAFCLTAYPVLAEESTSSAEQADESDKDKEEDSKTDDKLDEIDDLQKTIEELRSKINENKQEQRTLASTISVLNNRILLNEKEIEKTER